MPVNFKLRAIAREREKVRERAPAMMCFFNSALKQGQGKQTEFTLDFTFYKVLIIMLMADLCHIFIK